jgi:excisionase family DNA binding protein
MLWNVKQVAEYLSISSSMVYKLVGNFELQAIRVGDCIRFSPEAVEGFIRNNISTKRSGNNPEKPQEPAFDPNFQSYYMMF